MPQVPILTSGGLLVVDVTDPDEASLAGKYWSSGYEGFIETGDVGYLAPFEYETVAGYPLETDPDVIEDFYFDHGPIDVAEYYRS